MILSASGGQIFDLWGPLSHHVVGGTFPLILGPLSHHVVVCKVPASKGFGLGPGPRGDLPLGAPLGLPRALVELSRPNCPLTTYSEVVPTSDGAPLDLGPQVRACTFDVNRSGGTTSKLLVDALMQGPCPLISRATPLCCPRLSGRGQTSTQGIPPRSDREFAPFPVRSPLGSEGSRG